MNKSETTPYTSRLDRSIRPQDDFFGMVNHTWLASHPIPANEPWNGTFLTLANTVWAQMHLIYKDLLDKDAAPGSIEQQARDLYYTGVHYDSLKAEHLRCIKSYLNKIDAVKSLLGLSSVLGMLERVGVPGLWNSYVTVDNQDARRHIFHLTQPALTLPNRDYYLQDTPEMQKVRAAYEHHVKKVYALFPDTAPDAPMLWGTVWRIEHDLARHSRDSANMRDVHNNYNRKPFASLGHDYPVIDWDAFASAYGWQTGADLSVDQPEYFAYLQGQLGSRPLVMWKTYLKWRLIIAYYGKIDESYAKLRFSFFGKVLGGATRMLPLWKRVVRTIDDVFGNGIGRLYIERYFPESLYIEPSLSPL